MISVETQALLADVILAIAKEERALEVMREILAEQVLFCPYTAFLRIDRKNYGYVDKNDLQSFLR